MLSPLVSIRFQVLFHSPPGVLFTFPSRYYTLSVTWSYLALWDGPHSFMQNSTCSTLLWILLCFIVLSPTRLLLYLVHLSRYVQLELILQCCSPNPTNIAINGLGSYPFARHYLGNRLFTFFSSGYLDVSVLRVPFITV